MKLSDAIYWGMRNATISNRFYNMCFRIQAYAPYDVLEELDCANAAIWSDGWDSSSVCSCLKEHWRTRFHINLKPTQVDVMWANYYVWMRWDLLRKGL